MAFKVGSTIVITNSATAPQTVVAFPATMITTVTVTYSNVAIVTPGAKASISGSTLSFT